MITISGKYTTAKVMIDNIDSETVNQIYTFVNDQSFINSIAIMPDCHAGKGAVIGFTTKLSNKLIPMTIGTDIGCGMLSVKIDSLNNISLKEIDKFVRLNNGIPLGTRVNDYQQFDMKYFEYRLLNEKFVISNCDYSYEYFKNLCKRVDISIERAEYSIGSLGGGNHFIEIGKSVNDNSYWITIHSGSRQLGLKIANYWQNVAVEKHNNRIQNELQVGIEKIKEIHSQEYWQREIQILKEKLGAINHHKGLEYLTDEDMDGYLKDMLFAQEYASLNRHIIMNRIINFIVCNKIDEIETIHNFIDFGDMIIRKGAIRSYENERMIIPFNMEDGLVICEGKSNSEWNYSAPHGAGRLFSRSEAKRRLSKIEAENDIKNAGVYSSCIPLDEVKGAYKDSKIIEKAINPTARIIDKIKPVLNIKAS